MNREELKAPVGGIQKFSTEDGPGTGNCAINV